MKGMAKKFIIYAVVGVLQFGIGTATLEAAPRPDNQRPVPAHNYEDRNHQQQLRDDQHKYDRERRMQEERNRHEREMLRREHESEREWGERQRLENERHNQAMEALAAAVVLYSITTH